MKCSNSVSDSVSPIEYFYNSFVDQKHKFENKDIIQYKVYAKLSVDKVQIFSKETSLKQNLRRWEKFMTEQLLSYDPIEYDPSSLETNFSSTLQAKLKELLEQVQPNIYFINDRINLD